MDEGSVSWGTFDDAFVDELVAWIGDRRVLEIFAGNGLLASKLAARGVRMRATSLYSGHDGHSMGFRFPVEEMDAVEAVRAYGEESDILLMSWPTTTDAATAAVIAWGHDRPIVFIGEVTDYEKGHLGGCATDIFFELTEERSLFADYSGGMIERAGVRHLDRVAVNAWARRMNIVEPDEATPGRTL